MNPRLSRSSALASKATGYPLAYIAAKLALGHKLPDLANAVTKSTRACFEPSLDYIVTKIPRWDNGKFRFADTTLGSQMKSVGEVMAVGRSFEESFQKALRMVDTANEGFEAKTYDAETMRALMVRPNPQRPSAIAAALKSGMTADEIHNITNIDRWFLQKLAGITDMGKNLESKNLKTVSAEDLKDAKQAGFSDRQIASRIAPDEYNKPGNKLEAELQVRNLRKEHGIVPVVKQIDTLAAEFPAQTNYLYTSYNGTKDDIKFDEKGTMVIGSGVYRIGSSVEFDYSCVMALRSLRKQGQKTVMINYNPETVSTDYDESDRLYFEELSFERVMDIQDKENPNGVVVSMGGQTAQNLVMSLNKCMVPILGTSPEMIDVAEDRDKFSRLMDSV
jgi:carbamoyl-phosphate synthase large subunit